MLPSGLTLGEDGAEGTTGRENGSPNCANLWLGPVCRGLTPGSPDPKLLAAQNATLFGNRVLADTVGQDEGSQEQGGPLVQRD